MTLVRAVWLAIREGGTAMTVEQIARRCPPGNGAKHVAPAIGWLVMQGWVTRVGTGLQSRYVNSRLRGWV